VPTILCSGCACWLKAPDGIKSARCPKCGAVTTVETGPPINVIADDEWRFPRRIFITGAYFLAAILLLVLVAVLVPRKKTGSSKQPAIEDAAAPTPPGDAAESKTPSIPIDDFRNRLHPDFGKPGVPVFSDELYLAYDANPIAADSKFLDRIVTVNGYLLEIRRASDGSAMLMFGNPTRNWPVGCILLDERQAVPLKVCTLVTVKGICRGKVGAGILIDNGAFIEVVPFRKK
jgi:LSD1 subclass zinc finger protein